MELLLIILYQQVSLGILVTLLSLIFQKIAFTNILEVPE